MLFELGKEASMERLGMGHSRRAFIQRTALVGGAVWAAPVLTSAASGAAVSSSVCACTGDAYGLYAHLNDPHTFGPYPPAPNGPCDPVSVGGLVGLACATVTGCTATGSVADLSLSFAKGPLPALSVSASVISATVTADCCRATASSTITDLKINGTTVTITGSPQTINIDNVLTVTINGQTQTCDPKTGDETFTVTALEIVQNEIIPILGGFQVIAGFASITTSGGHCC
jgi:hypothetical protein